MWAIRSVVLSDFHLCMLDATVKLSTFKAFGRASDIRFATLFGGDDLIVLAVTAVISV